MLARRRKLCGVHCDRHRREWRRRRRWTMFFHRPCLVAVLRLVWLGWSLVLLGVALVLFVGHGHRLGWWPFTTGYSLLRYGTIAALLSIPLLAWGTWRVRLRRPRVLAVLGLFVALPAIALPLSWLYLATTLPVIHDISTDLDHPPDFVAVVPLRSDAPNPVVYGGPEIAAQQRQAYPDILPLHLSLPPAEAYARAAALARRMGWEIVAEDPQAGRIEATATTLLFGFKDDVVVRITPEEAGSRIDVRSLSRVGRSDVGTNARRIRSYLQRLQSAA